MQTGVRSRSYYSQTLWGASDHCYSREYFLKLIELPALIFTECAVIYNGKGQWSNHEEVLTIPRADPLQFQHHGQLKVQTQTTTESGH